MQAEWNRSRFWESPCRLWPRWCQENPMEKKPFTLQCPKKHRNIGMYHEEVIHMNQNPAWCEYFYLVMQCNKNSLPVQEVQQGLGVLHFPAGLLTLGDPENETSIVKFKQKFKSNSLQLCVIGGSTNPFSWWSRSSSLSNLSPQTRWPIFTQLPLRPRRTWGTRKAWVALKTSKSYILARDTCDEPHWLY